MAKTTNTKMKNILITLILFAVTINAKDYKVEFLPSGNPDEFMPLEILVVDIPNNHNGTFTYFVLDRQAKTVKGIFYNKPEAVSHSQINNDKILVTANIY